MARINKTEHPRILEMIDGEHRKVADVAAEYGCTPANIYALLGKLRRTTPPPTGVSPVAVGTPSQPVEADGQPTRIVPAAVPTSAVPDLFAPGRQVEQPSTAATQVASLRARGVAKPIAADPGASVDKPTPDIAAEPATPRQSTVTTLPIRGGVGKAGGLGAALAKPGFGLVMRTPEGEESLTPFRSLDDLLSAIKPILRAAARSPDAVWFSIQPVDLASLDSDAA